MTRNMLVALFYQRFNGRMVRWPAELVLQNVLRHNFVSGSCKTDWSGFSTWFLFVKDPILQSRCRTMMTCISKVWSQEVELPRIFRGFSPPPKINIKWERQFSVKAKCLRKHHFQLKTDFVYPYITYISQKVITMSSFYPS